MTQSQSRQARPHTRSDASQGSGSEPYAPFGLSVDASELGLEWRVFLTRLGPVSARVSSRGGPPGAGPGERPATLLLHGAAGSWSTWTPLLRTLGDEDGRPADLIVVDLPGWGDSPLTTPTSDVDAYAEAALDVVRSLGYRSWHVVGHSMGAFIALHIAAVHREATLSLGLVSPTTFSVAEVARKPWRSARADLAFAGLLTVLRCFAPFGRAASRLLRAIDRVGLLRAVVAPLFAHPLAVPASVVTALADEVRPAAFVRAADAAAAYDLSGSWSRIRCRVVAVVGDDDTFIGADDQRMLERVVPSLATVVVPSAGHFAHVERPQAVAAALGDAFSPRS